MTRRRRHGRRTSLGAAAVPLAVLCATALAGCSAPRLPQGFPPAVPMVDGPVLSAAHDVYEWHVWVRADHPTVAYRRARALLLAGGYDETHDDETAGGSDGQFCDATWCVTITGYRDPHYGESVMYEIFRTVGLGPPEPLG